MIMMYRPVFFIGVLLKAAVVHRTGEPGRKFTAEFPASGSIEELWLTTGGSIIEYHDVMCTCCALVFFRCRV
jgi:hypothetical protein